MFWVLDKAGLSSESDEISATTEAPTIPDIRGLYIGTATSTQTNCQNPADDGTFSFSDSINIVDQSNGNFNGTGSFTGFLDGNNIRDELVLSGFVSPQGEITDTFANTFFINNIFNSSGQARLPRLAKHGGQGTFTGQFLNDILNLSFSTQDIVGDTCSVQGTLTAARQ